jgi:hypothetical protein
LGCTITGRERFEPLRSDLRLLTSGQSQKHILQSRFNPFQTNVQYPILVQVLADILGLRFGRSDRPQMIASQPSLSAW